MSFSSFISQKPGEKPISRTFFVKFSILAYISLKSAILSSAMIMTSLSHHCDVILGMLVLILVCMERGDP